MGKWLELFLRSQGPTLEDLGLLLNFRENRNLDFKIKWDESCLEDVVAFTNSDGGLLCIGFDNSGNLIGMEDNVIESTIRQQIRDLIEPDPSPNVMVLEFQASADKVVYLVEITADRYLHALRKTHNRRNNYVYFIRKGASTEYATPELMNRIMYSHENYWSNVNYRKQLLEKIDNFICKESEITGLNLDEVLLESKDIAEWIDVNKKSSVSYLQKVILNSTVASIANLASIVVSFKSELTRVEETVSHKSLSSEEEQSLRDLKNLLNENGYDSFLIRSYFHVYPHDEDAKRQKLWIAYLSCLEQYEESEEMLHLNLGQDFEQCLRKGGYFKKTREYLTEAFKDRMDEFILSASSSIILFTLYSIRLQKRVKENLELFGES